MGTLTQRNFNKPDQSMDMGERIAIDAVDIGGVKVMRVTTEPGWRWSVNTRPVQKTDSCQINHLFYVVSGRIAVRDNSGQEIEYGAGDLAHIPPGHDGWTLGDEPTVWIEIPH